MYSVLGQVKFQLQSPGPTTTMRELITQGKKCWDPHPMVRFQEAFSYNVIDLICIQENPVDSLTRKPTVDIALKFLGGF